VKGFKHLRLVLWCVEGSTPCVKKNFLIRFMKISQVTLLVAVVPDPRTHGPLYPWKPSNSRTIKVVRMIESYLFVRCRTSFYTTSDEHYYFQWNPTWRRPPCWNFGKKQHLTNRWTVFDYLSSYDVIPHKDVPFVGFRWYGFPLSGLNTIKLPK